MTVKDHDFSVVMTTANSSSGPIFDEAFHFPADLLEQLIATIPLLVRSKRSVFTFFRGAGVSQAILADLEAELARDKDSLNKFSITRNVLTRLNERGDATLAARREVIKRVVEFEDFSTCWDSDQQKARGQVAAIRQSVNVHDSFTRMAKEREQEAARRREAHADELAKTREHSAAVAAVKDKLFALFGETNPHRRGKALEKVLNDLFAAYGILVRESFELIGDAGEGIVEQIDGVIELDGQIYLVELKWWAENIGVGDVSAHMVRVFGRDGARGMFIANPGFTEPAIRAVRDALRQKTMVLATLHEIVMLLTNGGDLRELLRDKIRAAVIDSNPLLDSTRR
jgi:restriction system protein